MRKSRFTEEKMVEILREADRAPVAQVAKKQRACALVGAARSSLDDESKLDAKDAPILAAMRELAAQYPRYGYRRIQAPGSEETPAQAHFN